jgi:hypothetical protein
MDTMKRCTVWLALVLAGCNSSSSKLNRPEFSGGTNS